MGVNYWTINLVIVLITGVGGLRDVEIRAPLAVAPGKSATLICRYDLEGDPLYTVKWYKGRQEFFRYVPKELPHTRVFPLPGINVDINASGPDRVVLRDVQKELSGKYRCEVSADAPNFHTQVVSTQMHVVNQLEEEPTIFIEKRRYAVGETIRGNCTGPPSNPAANITWTINSHKIKSSYIKRMPLSSGEEAKVLTSAGLEFEVTITSFQGGKLSLVCTADVYQVHWKQTRIVIEEERPRLASVMGTRDTNTGGRPSWTSVLSILPLAVLISR